MFFIPLNTPCRILCCLTEIDFTLGGATILGTVQMCKHGKQAMSPSQMIFEPETRVPLPTKDLLLDL